jgi:hypothetical protein
MPRRVPRETRQAHVELTTVSGPYNTPDRVLRRVDGLARLRGNGVIDDRGMRAADKYRSAVQIIDGNGMRCALAGEPGSASPSSRLPPLVVLEAATTLKQAKDHLGAHDGRVVWLVVGEGQSIATTAQRLFGSAAAREISHVSHRLKWALSELADYWFGSEQRRPSHFHRASDARPEDLATGELLPAKVAHASRKGVAYA